MRSLLVTGTAGGLLAAALLSAEARAGRGLRLRGPILAQDRPAPTPERARVGVGAALPIAVPAAAGTAGVAGSGPGAAPAEASGVWPPDAAPRWAAEAAPGQGAAGRVADATPWCRPDRIAGSGVGFCLIN
ncbi:hypothetical protein [Methylobacterium planeticum]|uniref:Uncharacterized protein n=1 Tax=Methylobacterium planeticum TaxID=2615211 RepID=A0A6N6MV90_9HYPH|nr:hypothetical protein [Methylobacterium planeticum]KAB1074413.1 hypothetical protein F6X51_08610 [Methylobacterium planeticum]